MFCPRCGVQLVEGVRFCRDCGADLAAVSGAPPVAGVPAPVPSGPPAPIEDGRDGPPWEHRGGTFDFGALVETMTAVLFRPNETFTRMRPEGGIESPLLYALLPGVVALIITTLINSAMIPWVQSTLESMKDQLPPGAAEMFGQMAVGGPLAQALGVVFKVMWLVMALFVVAALLHGCLLLVGGAHRPYEATFRTYCYVSGSFAVIQVIPVCGWAVGLVWAPIVLILGLARAHETDTWRSALAVSIPAIVCCGLLGAAAAIGFGAAMSASG